MSDAAMPLSTDDILLLQSLQRRQVKLPIMMLDTLLPQQVVTVRSSDPTFSQLLKFAMSNSAGRVAVMGMHPVSGNALSYGVVAKVDVLPHIDGNAESGSTTVALTALHRIHVSGHVTVQNQQGFSVADCEILNDDMERSQGDIDMKAPQLAARLTKLIEQWIDSAASVGATVREFSPGFSLNKEVTSKDWSLLAFYTATILQPIPATATAANIDIRPAMITAQTAYERLLLAVTALQIHLDGHASN
jgi:ATP-dependent protease La (LON) substrate-binding domain